MNVMDLPTLKAMLAQKRLRALAKIGEGERELREAEGQLAGIEAAEKLAAPPEPTADPKPEPDPE